MKTLAKLRFCVTFAIFYLTASCSTLGFGGQFQVKNYMLVGKLNFQSADEDSAKRNYPFLIAVAPNRVLTGLRTRSRQESFEYSSDADLRSVSFEIEAKLADNLLESQSRRLQAIVRQRQMKENSYAARFANAQTATFAKANFALFFSADYLGVSPDDVFSLLAQGKERAAKRIPCGILTVVSQNGGLKTIEFSQDEEDVFTSRNPDKKLNEVKYDPFATGLKRVDVRCVFDPPLTADMKAPWTATYRTKEEGRNGKSVEEKATVEIQECTTDLDRINREIDKILSVVPEGSRVVADVPNKYVWRKGRVEANSVVAKKSDGKKTQTVDPAKRSDADRRNRFSWTWIAAVAVTSIVLAGLLVVRLGMRKS